MSGIPKPDNACGVVYSTEESLTTAAQFQITQHNARAKNQKFGGAPVLSIVRIAIL